MSTRNPGSSRTVITEARTTAHGNYRKRPAPQPARAASTPQSLPRGNSAGRRPKPRPPRAGGQPAVSLEGSKTWARALSAGDGHQMALPHREPEPGRRGDRKRRHRILISGPHRKCTLAPASGPGYEDFCGVSARGWS